MIPLSAQQKKSLASVLSQLPAGTPHVALDPTVNAHQQVINTFLELANKTADRYPALHASLAKQAKSGRRLKSTAPADHATVVDVGADRSGRATARTWVSPTGGSVLTSASTLVVDAETNEPLAFGTHTTVGARLTTASTATATAKPASGKLRAITLYHSLPAANKPVRFGLVSAMATPNLGASAAGSTLPVNLTAPVITISGHTAIQIALNRGTPQPPFDCDYIFTGDNQVSNPYLLVPFVGNLQLPNTIAGYGANGFFASGGNLGVTATIYAAVTPGGASYASTASPVNPTSLYGNISVVAAAGDPVPANPTTLYWNWPFVAATPQATNPALAFNTDNDANAILTNAGTTWVNSAFFFQFRVPILTGTGTSTYTFNVCSYDTPNEVGSQCFQIPDLQFWWHCLAAGTLVTLENGRKLPIEKVTNTMRVRTGHGTASIGVEATTAGYHRARKDGRPSEAIYKLVTKRGRTLILTSEHPVATPRGLATPMHLKTGDEILSVTGPDRVKSCAPIAHSGEFYNLRLGDAHDRRNGVSADALTFVASDLLVGDALALHRHHHATTHNFDLMRGRLPKSLHKDYASALADIARQP